MTSVFRSFKLLVQPLGYWPKFLTAVNSGLCSCHTVINWPLSLDYEHNDCCKIYNSRRSTRDINIQKRNIYFFLYKEFSVPYSRVTSMSYSPVHHVLSYFLRETVVRLACVKHLNSVQSEPSPNSFFLQRNMNFFIIFFIFSF